jgi:flagellar biosynthesis protein FliR
MIPSLPFTTFNEFMAFTVVLGRLAGILSALPLFGGRAVPNRVKVVLTLAMTLVLYPVISSRVPPLPGDTISLVLIVVRETLIGLSLGILSQIIFAAVEFCGQMVSIQTGLAIATQFDPMAGTQFSALGILQNLLAMLLFMALGAHHIFFRAIVESYQLIPVGGWHISGEVVQYLTNAVAQIFILGLKLAGPVMAALLGTSVVLGIMARAFPQMNIFLVSMPLNIGIGFLLLGLSTLVFMHTLEKSFAGIPLGLRALFKLLG